MGYVSGFVASEVMTKSPVDGSRHPAQLTITVDYFVVGEPLSFFAEPRFSRPDVIQKVLIDRGSIAPRRSHRFYVPPVVERPGRHGFSIVDADGLRNRKRRAVGKTMSGELKQWSFSYKLLTELRRQLIEQRLLFRGDLAA